MSSAMADDYKVEVSVADRKNKSGKKPKYEKGVGEHKSKKRHREATDIAEGAGRKHKKSKSHVSSDDVSNALSVVADHPEILAPATLPSNEKEKKSKKAKKDKLSNHQDAQQQEAQRDNTKNDDEPIKEKKKPKKDKRKHETQEGGHITQPVILNGQEAPATKHKKEKRRHKDGAKENHDDNLELMDIDSATPKSKPVTSKAPNDQSDQAFPFFTQTVSQYLPLFPQGLVEPIEGYAEQHLGPLLNRYVPAFRGVLLAYRNPRIGEAPGRGSLTEKSEIEDTALLESIDEYAVGFGWLTIEADLFCPKRGSWMEGTLNLQSEGFIGVICFGMFNASVEASRLPSGWKWIDLLESSKEKGKRQHNKPAAEGQLPTPEPQDEVRGENENEDEGDGMNQAHSTGYWVDETGSKVGGKLRFCIKNYEVGSIGDYGYLSIEGTMLDEEAERGKVAEEMETDRRRKLKSGGLLRKSLKRLPEFSMTKFGEKDDEQDDILRSVGLKSKRVGGDQTAG